MLLAVGHPNDICKICTTLYPVTFQRKEVFAIHGISLCSTKQKKKKKKLCHIKGLFFFFINYLIYLNSIEETTRWDEIQLYQETKPFVGLIFNSKPSMKGLDSLIGACGCGSLNKCDTAVKHSGGFIQPGRDWSTRPSKQSTIGE